MPKLVVYHRRPKGTSRSEFLVEWRETVAPRIAALQAELGFSRYAQIACEPWWHPVVLAVDASRSWPVALALNLLTRARGGIGAPWQAGGVRRRERWDVVDELWWPSDEALDQLLQAPGDPLRGLRGIWQGRTALSATLLGRELLVDERGEEGASPARIAFCLRGKKGQGADVSKEYWRHSHAELVTSLSTKLGYQRYDQLHAPDVAEPIVAKLGTSPQGDDAYLGMASLSYPSLRTVLGTFFRPRTQVANLKLMADELNFIDPPRTIAVLGTRTSIC